MASPAALPSATEYTAAEYAFVAPLAPLALPLAAPATPPRPRTPPNGVVYDTPAGYPSLATAYGDPKRSGGKAAELAQPTQLRVEEALPMPNEYIAWESVAPARDRRKPPQHPKKPRTSAVRAELGLSPRLRKATVSAGSPPKPAATGDELGGSAEWRREELVLQMDVLSHLIKHHTEKEGIELQSRYKNVEGMLTQMDKAAAAAEGAQTEQILKLSPASSETPPSATREVTTGGSSEGGVALAAGGDTLVQYVVVRKDLSKAPMGWGAGPIMAQACHAAVAAIWLSKDTPNTQAYCAPDALDSMTKVTMEIKNEGQLMKLVDGLTKAGLIFKLWIEQPEGIPTALATSPVYREEKRALFKKCQLYRG